MSASINKNQSKCFIVLFPDEKPVRFNMAFPCKIEFSVQFMRFTLSRNSAGRDKHLNNFFKQRKV